MQYTFAMIKSGAVERKQALPILGAAHLIGLRVIQFQHHEMTLEEAEFLYHEHIKKPYWPELLASVQGPCGVVLAILHGPNAIRAWRNLLGATNAMKAAPGTIRHTYGANATADNAAHGSATVADANRELQLFFYDQMRNVHMMQPSLQDAV